MAQTLETTIDTILGQEFLTWLWYHSEERGGTFNTIKSSEPYVLYIHQKIVVRGGSGDQAETAAVSGIHSSLREAKMGLLTGKYVVSALIRFEQGDLNWQFNCKAEDFSLNSFKTAAVSKEDKDEDNQDALFLEKMYLIEKGLELIDDIYQQFLQLRLNQGEWKEQCALIHTWINADR